MSLQSDFILDYTKVDPASTPKNQDALNQQLVRMLEKGPKWYEVGAPRYREMRSNGETSFPKPIALEQGKSIQLPSREPGREIPCRQMLPDDGHVTGVYLHIHGGGWVLQNEIESDVLLLALANEAHLAVLSIGYRLAPEHIYPAGPEDCIDVAMHLTQHAQSMYSAPLAFIGGESAGGHLTMVTALHLLSQPTLPLPPLRGLVLNFGIFDLSGLPQSRNFTKQLILTPDIMQAFIEAFIPGASKEKLKDPAISPFYAHLNELGGKLPPALFLCGTEDCLLEDSVFMHARWLMAGGESVLKLFPGAPHGFIAFDPNTVPAAKEAKEITGEWLRARSG
ncbi:hypothetical protein MMC25_000526 [Agyrium rufum]|nr:hypothetical protein [Agyrium rufum]